MDHQHAIGTLAMERYLLSEMSEHEALEFEDHYFSCSSCAEDARMAFLMVSGAKELARDRNGVRERLTGSGSVRRFYPAASLAMAASLLLVLGYQSLVVIPRIRGAARPVAVTPVVLTARRSAAAESTITIRADQQIIVLGVDVNAHPPPEQIDYVLSSADGIPIVSDRVKAPPPGSSLLLLIPIATLPTADRYRLQLRDPSEGGKALDEYRFSIQRR
jgi:hypothetical protein